MPDEPLPSDAESIISAIRRLSAQSTKLKESAKKNTDEADRLTENIALLQRKLRRIAAR